MNVLIYGAGNSIAISLARYLDRTGHTAVLADTRRYVRGFYSRYCKRKYRFRDPYNNRKDFASDINECIKKEDIKLILPTYDDALFHLIDVGQTIPESAKVPIPLDLEKISLVMNKKNIPFICSRSGIDVIPTYPIDGNLRISEMEKFPSFVLKKTYGVSGEGFIKHDKLQGLEEEIERITAKGMGDKYLVQKYIAGPVYGAGGVFEDKELKFLYSYRYFRRYPEAGASTICVVDCIDEIRSAMTKVLSTLQWEGFCHMDFIMEDKTGIPYLTDINPVHWYSVPNSRSENFNCLSYYIEGKKRESWKSSGVYVTVSPLRELQRIIMGGIVGRQAKSDEISYWRHLKRVSTSDIYWDPMPVVLAPFLSGLRYLDKKR